MTRKQLQSLISAGMFSATLLSGVAYADDATTGNAAPTSAATPAATDASAPAATTPVKKHKKHKMKNLPAHSCAAKNDCKGQGGCKTSAQGCKGKNDCKGKGGCATDGSKAS